MKEKWKENALDFEGYLEHADMNVPTMRLNFREIAIGEEDAAYFGSLDERHISVTAMAFSESWCGDCVENLPVLARIAQEYKFLKLLIFPRDTNLDIMEEVSKTKNIPLFIFYDGDNKEIGRFLERPEGAHEFIKKGMERIQLLPEEQRDKARLALRSGLRKEYRKGLRQETIGDIRGILEKRYG